MNVGDIRFSIPCRSLDESKFYLNKMIIKLGKEETVKRFAWLQNGQLFAVEKLIDQFLTGNYIDDKGVKGGDDFWGDL